MNEETSSALGDAFDRVVRHLDGLPDTVHTRPTTIRTLTPVLSLSQTWIVETYRQREVGDTILVGYAAADGHVRLAIPPAVAKAIAAQYDQLSTKNRKRGARQAYETKLAAGSDPAIHLKKARAKKRSRKAVV